MHNVSAITFLLVLVGAVALAVITSSVAFTQSALTTTLTQTVTSTTTSVSILTSTVISVSTLSPTSSGVNRTLQAQVNSAFTDHLLALDSRNTSALRREYEDDAALVWTGNCDGWCNYNDNSTSIAVLYSAFFNSTPSFHAANATYSAGLAGDSAIVNSMLNLTGYGTYSGRFNATISAQILYVREGSSWQITSENWRFIGVETQDLTPQGRI